MRISLLSRSVIGAATLAVASATLAAVPASAATPSGVTRDQVLAATAVARAALAAFDPDEPGEVIALTDNSTRVLANRACSVNPDAEFLAGAYGFPTQAGDDADGLMLAAFIMDLSAVGGADPLRICAFGALASTDPSYSLSGTATLNFMTTTTHALSGDVYVTPPRNVRSSDFQGADGMPVPSFTASGNATKNIPTKVSTPKTTKQKKAAKKAYDKALKSAKKSYTKALKKADGNKKKKAAVKKAYNKKKAAAKAKYKKATATFKIVNHTDARPFSLLAIAPEVATPAP